MFEKFVDTLVQKFIIYTRENDADSYLKENLLAFLEEEGIDGSVALQYAAKYDELADFSFQTDGSETTITDLALVALYSYIWEKYDRVIDSKIQG